MQALLQMLFCRRLWQKNNINCNKYEAGCGPTARQASFFQEIDND